MARKENPIPTGSLDVLPLGARMRQARQEHGLSLGDVASHLGYSKAHLSAVENCTVRPSRDLVAGYERMMALAPQTLIAVYDRDQVATAVKSKPIRQASPSRVPALSWDAQSSSLSLDSELARVLSAA